MKYIIEGGKKLNGEIKTGGNKNSVLPCIAAALLTEEEVIIENVPQIKDVEVLCHILKELGVGVAAGEDKLTIHARSIELNALPEKLVTRLRASILLVGPLLARRGRAQSHFPGGDVIGKRNIKVHLDGFEVLGARLKQEDLEFSIEYPGRKRPNRNSNIFLEEASCTALENLLMASALGDGEITIRNCPKEPQIVDLCQMLISMGANIQGVGSDTLIVKGVQKLSGTTFKVSDDYIEVITYAVAASITRGKIKIICDLGLDLEPIMVVLKHFGIKLTKHDNYLEAEALQLVGVDKIVTNIWPGFPTDLMSAVIVLATQAKGETLCHDWMYESRMFFADKLISMGADITIADPHRVVVYGPTKLRARELETPDIRAGMALVLAALVAKGTSYINKAELIERGYEDVVGKLKSLGAKIEKI